MNPIKPILVERPKTLIYLSPIEILQMNDLALEASPEVLKDGKEPGPMSLPMFCHHSINLDYSLLK
jgi:hypothetical protein